jgi:DNA-binding response OmpR family regulator
METTSTTANNKKILAIEDDPDVLSLYVSFFKKQGYDVVTASGAVEAMATLEANPDTRLVLLDLNLPGMSGEEWMKWYFERPNKVPVVVASGKGDILTITRDQNMTAALTKPFHMEELQELVEVLMADDWRGEVSGDPMLH